MSACLTRVMQLLAEHVWRDERDAFLGYAETARPVVIVVLTDHGAFLDDRARIDDALLEPAVALDVHSSGLHLPRFECGMCRAKMGRGRAHYGRRHVV